MLDENGIFMRLEGIEIASDLNVDSRERERRRGNGAWEIWPTSFIHFLIEFSKQTWPAGATIIIITWSALETFLIDASSIDRPR